MNESALARIAQAIEDQNVRLSEINTALASIAADLSDVVCEDAWKESAIRIVLGHKKRGAERGAKRKESRE